ncbi:MAG: hypothetical protein Q7S22_05065 [Candidatus Micrarchaeota archaeon]|nr:hypothetical protein [Candidatus Micrarchaeota archaeon]
MTEYISKKIPRETDVVLKYVQAHYQLEKGAKATEAEVLDYAIKHVAEEQYGYATKKKVRNGLGLLGGAGIIKGGKKSSSEDIDTIVYGI